ncbi:replication factor C subunit 2-like isoform X1 [Periplaneta americana]|uniref:replication factor C subunit 2-like isoform X1 n=1 Tax=Periplaneta americana TaxID=6978 RepID=UPI0037E7BFDB
MSCETKSKCLPAEGYSVIRETQNYHPGRGRQISYTEDGLAAIVFTALGDMRQALNNLQSTCNGFKHVSSRNVFKIISSLWKVGYAAEDVIGNIFRVTEIMQMPEELKLDFTKETGTTRLRIVDVLTSLLQPRGLPGGYGRNC